MVIDGREYKERREAGVELAKPAKRLNEKARKSGGEVEKGLGRYADLPLSIRSSGQWVSGRMRYYNCTPFFVLLRETRFRSP
jgi:hypothetical protein